MMFFIPQLSLIERVNTIDLRREGTIHQMNDIDDAFTVVILRKDVNFDLC